MKVRKYFGVVLLSSVLSAESVNGASVPAANLVNSGGSVLQGEALTNLTKSIELLIAKDSAAAASVSGASTCFFVAASFAAGAALGYFSHSGRWLYRKINGNADNEVESTPLEVPVFNIPQPEVTRVMVEDFITHSARNLQEGPIAAAVKDIIRRIGIVLNDPAPTQALLNAALRYAVIIGNFSQGVGLIKQLIDKGANVNVVDKHNQPLLYYAIFLCVPAAVKLLIEKGVALDTTIDGVSVVDFAKQQAVIGHGLPVEGYAFMVGYEEIEIMVCEAVANRIKEDDKRRNVGSNTPVNSNAQGG